MTLKCLRCDTVFIAGKRATKKKFCGKKCQVRHWVENNREKNNKKVRNYRARRYAEDGFWRDEGKKSRELKAWMQELKSKPCADCGLSFPACCMDFDHRVGTIKEYNIGTMFAHHYGLPLIRAEVEKCDLVCSNCHRIRTRDRRLGNGRNKKAA